MGNDDSERLCDSTMLRLQYRVATTFHSLLATESESLSHHSSDILIILTCADCHKVFRLVL